MRSCSSEFSFVPKGLSNQVNRKYCSKPHALSGTKKGFDRWNQQSDRMRAAKKEDTKYIWK
jgi:hypothetical protein